MTLEAAVLERLAEPLDPARVKHREGGGGRSLSYLEGHDAIRAANDIFGVGQWGYAVTELVCIGEEEVVSRQNKPGFRVAYRATVTAHVGMQTFADVGYGDAIEYTGSRLTPHELASKEAVTDGLKRCLKNLGDQFGLCLYDKDAPEHRGQSQAGRVRPQASAASGAGETGSHGPASGFVFASGKYEGKTLDEVPSSYLDWYAEQGPRPDVKAAIAEYRAKKSGENFETAGAQVDDDIPFAPTIDGTV